MIDDTPVAPAPWVRVGRGPQRRTRWDRPPDPKDWRFFVGWLGRILIVLGLLMFLFVAYQLWGTGIETARAQNRLDDEWTELLEEYADEPARSTVAPATTTATPPTTQPAAPGTTPVEAPAPSTVPPATDPPAVPADEQNLPVPDRGDLVARLVIPRIGLDWKVVSGVSRDDLKQGPGHFRDTPFPGQLGNSAIAGHRTTSGAPFGNLDQLAPGDDIEVTLPNGEMYTYVVSSTEIVSPDDYHVISNSDPTRATLTLVTCHPKWTSESRLIVHADLDPNRSGQVGEPIITGDAEPAEIDVPATTAPTATTTAPTTATPTTGTTAPVSEPATTIDSAAATTVAATRPPTSEPQAPIEHEDTDAFSEGWFADSAAWPQIILWGLALGGLITIGWRVARFWKREWTGAVAVAIPFVVCLYFFFQNVNRLLPAGL